MPNAIMKARALISNIQEARLEPLEKKRLLYVNSLEHKKIQDRKQIWIYREPDYGISPLVSEMQASPVMPQGTYRQFEAGPVCTRHIKRFSSEELQNLVSPDARYRINTKEHIIAEMADSERRIWDTMELIACQALVLGTVKYVLNDSIGRMSVNITFPVPNATVSTSWHTTTTDIPADVNNYVKIYRNRFGRKPAKIAGHHPPTAESGRDRRENGPRDLAR